MVRRNVDTNAIVITDSHLGYSGFDKKYAAHLTVNHSESQYRDGVAYNNSVEGFFSLLKEIFTAHITAFAKASA